jgi:hypothetical protein
MQFDTSSICSGLLVCSSLHCHAYYMPCLFHPPWLCHCNYIYWRVQHSMQHSAALLSAKSNKQMGTQDNTRMSGTQVIMKCIKKKLHGLNQYIYRNLRTQQSQCSFYCALLTLHGLSPRANYTDRATAACRRSGCQLLRIEGATWSAWRVPTAVFSIC